MLWKLSWVRLNVIDSEDVLIEPEMSVEPELSEVVDAAAIKRPVSWCSDSKVRFRDRSAMVWYLEKSVVEVMLLCDVRGSKMDCREFIRVCASMRLNCDDPRSSELPFESQPLSKYIPAPRPIVPSNLLRL
jgi:hypothetical protein